MTCVNRLNYNYYYLAFDVVHESNYKMLGEKEGRDDMWGTQGVFPSRVVKSNLCWGGGSCLKSTVLNVLLQITFP